MPFKLLFGVFLLFQGNVFARQTYTIPLRNDDVPVISGHLKQGTSTSLAGNTLSSNNLYFIKNGKPWFPVMGEIHFSRFPKAQWEESILKMKAAGIDVIASYVFWIYHEEEEGKFDWSGNKDLHEFAALCKKHHVFLFIRIGPWCHGEVRNGGFPDWLLKRGNTRKNDPAYLASVQKYYTEVGKQLSGLYFKDGGPVIGTQIENEFRFNNAAGLEHILTLKKMAIQAGIDVPYYTATGWPGSNQQQDELMPVWGAYPEAPWDKQTTQLPLSENYLFGTLRNDPAIGTDIAGKQENTTVTYKGYPYPYATAEMGGGNEVTYHRRPVIKEEDVTSLAYVKTGSGANLMGYYMFHGGADPIGKLSTLQESKATGYPNDYPIISYDFFSPIGEWGQLRPSYRGFKLFHQFLNDFGDRLAQDYPAFPEQMPAGAGDNTTLRLAARSKDNSGFLFINNFQRQMEMKDFTNVRFTLTLKGGGTLTFPRSSITIKNGLEAILPFNMDLDGVQLQYATAQPVCRIGGKNPLFVFFAPEGISPEYCIDKAHLFSLTSAHAKIIEGADHYLVTGVAPGTAAVTTLLLRGGKQIRILTLTKQQARDCWKADVFGAERLIISSSELTFPGNDLVVHGTGDPKFNFAIYPDPGDLHVATQSLVKTAGKGLFTHYSMALQPVRLPAVFHEINALSGFKYKGPAIPADDRNSKNIPSSIGPQYQTTLTEVKGAKYWEIGIPDYAARGLSDAFVQIDYTGDTGAIYFEGKLIADDFYTGEPMIVGLKRFGKALAGKKLLLQVVPLTDERQIYFEKGVRDPLMGREAAALSGISIVPQYSFTIKK